MFSLETKPKPNLSFLPVVSLGLEKFEFFLSHTEGIGKWTASTVCSSTSKGFCLLFFFTKPLCPWIFALQIICYINHVINTLYTKYDPSKKLILLRNPYDNSNVLKYWKHILIVEFYTNLDKYRSVHDKMCSYCLKFFTEIETLMASLLTSNTISLNLQNE